MVLPQAFLSLEASISGTMASGWRKQAKELFDQLHPALEAGEFGQAYDLANRITLNGVASAKRKRLEELAVSSLLFGAQIVAGKPAATSFVANKRPLPFELQLALDQMVTSIEMHGSEQIRQEVLSLIRAEEEARKDAVLALQKADKSLADRLNDAVVGSGKAVIDIGANLTTSRLVSLGFLAEAVEKSISTYQVNEVLDKRTCSVCRYMHGKTFTVESEMGRLVQALSIQDAKELKSIAPWPSRSKAGMASLQSMSLSGMQAAGFGSPPYHPGCRGMLALEGTVEEVIPVTVAEPVTVREIVPEPLPPMIIEPATGPLGYIETPAGQAMAMYQQALKSVETDNISYSQFQAIEKYCGMKYTEVNRYLREGKLPSARSNLDEVKGIIKQVDDAMELSEVSRELTVYRGIKDPVQTFGVEDLSELLGKRVTDRGYLSTTADLNVASEFQDVHGITMEIKLPKGQKAIMPEAFDGMDLGPESEVLLPRGTTLRITGMKKDAWGDVKLFAEVVQSTQKSDETMVIHTIDVGKFIWAPGELQVE